MQDFVARQNVEHFRHMLETERDSKQRGRLEQLLTEAMAEVKRAAGLHWDRSNGEPERR